MMRLCGLPSGGTVGPSSPLPDLSCGCCFILYKQLIMDTGTGSQGTESFSISRAPLLHWNTAQRFQQMRWWKVSPPHGPQPLIWTFTANMSHSYKSLLWTFPLSFHKSLTATFSQFFSCGKARGGPSPKFCRFYRCLGITQKAKWAHREVLYVPPQGELPWGCRGNHCKAMQTSGTKCGVTNYHL